MQLAEGEVGEHHDVVFRIRPAAEGGGYLVTTNPSPQSKAYTLQEQMRTQGFGDTMKSIGIIIILGIMIGVLLEQTGATISMANAILKMTGINNAGLAIGITGIITGIPIFCNSGFIVLSGLNKSLVKSTGKP